MEKENNLKKYLFFNFSPTIPLNFQIWVFQITNYFSLQQSMA